MKIKKISLGWIVATDAARSTAFFTKVLGMQLAASTPEYGWYELKGQQSGGALLGVAQQQQSQNDQAGQNAVLTLEVDDLDAAVSELKAKEVRFAGEILEVPGHVRMISFLDPDDNKFQLVQVLGIP